MNVCTCIRNHLKRGSSDFNLQRHYTMFSRISHKSGGGSPYSSSSGNYLVIVACFVIWSAFIAFGEHEMGLSESSVWVCVWTCTYTCDRSSCWWTFSRLQLTVPLCGSCLPSAKKPTKLHKLKCVWVCREKARSWQVQIVLSFWCHSAQLFVSPSPCLAGCKSQNEPKDPVSSVLLAGYQRKY